MDVLSRAVMCFCLMTLGWSSATQYTSNNMKNNIDKLKVHYKISKDQLFNGNSVFPKDMLEDSERRVLMSVVLDVYLSIFSQMLNQTVDQEVRETVVQLQGKVQELQKNYFLGRIPDLRRHLQNLWAIKTASDRWATHTEKEGRCFARMLSLTSDTTVQGKALSEFFSIYKKASKLAKLDNGRKRRQAQRLKSHIM